VTGPELIAHAWLELAVGVFQDKIAEMERRAGDDTEYAMPGSADIADRAVGGEVDEMEQGEAA